jgi:cyanophycinase-like exopeptidase
MSTRIVIEHANAPSVDILVVPSLYGDDPADREENIELAGERTQQIEDACNTVVDLAQFPEGCDATLLILFDRNDAQDFNSSLALYSKATDGAYILGGDQDIAMHVLARTPAELAMTVAYSRGVVFGGTSAGAAVQSRARARSSLSRPLVSRQATRRRSRMTTSRGCSRLGCLDISSRQSSTTSSRGRTRRRPASTARQPWSSSVVISRNWPGLSATQRSSPSSVRL